MKNYQWMQGVEGEEAFRVLEGKGRVVRRWREVFALDQMQPVSDWPIVQGSLP